MFYIIWCDIHLSLFSNLIKIEPSIKKVKEKIEIVEGNKDWHLFYAYIFLLNITRSFTKCMHFGLVLKLVSYYKHINIIYKEDFSLSSCVPC